MVPVGQIVGQLHAPHLELDAQGCPRQPVLLIDTDEARERLDAGDLSRAAQHIAAAAPLTVAITRGDQPLGPVAAAADMSLARGDLRARFTGAADRAPHHDETVGCPDPVAAATALEARVARAPRAALTLAWLLRAGEHQGVGAALASESAAYSMLLGSSEFDRWLTARGPGRLAGDPGRVRMQRDGDELTITLARPGRRNAVDASMRDALVEALAVAEADPTLRVNIVGLGPTFCAGGDLDEFGTTRDPAASHLIRVGASPAAALHRIRDRVTVRVHGTCIGAGVELPAFAGRVIAAPESEFGLPELGMGLVPGAGGTVSIPRRVGRKRTLWFALSGERLDAPTALAWGLVDAIQEPPADGWIPGWSDAR